MTSFMGPLPKPPPPAPLCVRGFRSGGSRGAPRGGTRNSTPPYPHLGARSGGRPVSPRLLSFCWGGQNVKLRFGVGRGVPAVGTCKLVRLLEGNLIHCARQRQPCGDLR